MDYSRKFDLEEIADAIQNAKSRAESEYYERIAYRIIGESDEVKYWREQLMLAIRADENRRKQYCIEMIQKIKLDDTSGGSWGSNKGNALN